MSRLLWSLRILLLGFAVVWLLTACRPEEFSDREVKSSSVSIPDEAKECSRVPAIATLAATHAGLTVSTHLVEIQTPSAFDEVRATQIATPDTRDFSVEARKWFAPNQQYAKRLVKALPINPEGGYRVFDLPPYVP